MKNHFFLLIIIFILFPYLGRSQDDDLSKLLDSLSPVETQYTLATFKSTRVIDGQSIERMQKKQLDFRISHRFGFVNQGVNEFFGLDQSSICLSLEYGITNWMMVGLARTTDEKTVNGFIKFSLFRQCSGKRNFPVSISYYANTSVITKKWDDPTRTNYFSSRVAYVNQVLVARKFNEKISLQIAPVWVHKNLVPTVLDNNDIFAVGLGGRYKIARRVSFNAEYYPVIRPVWNYKDPNHTNALSFGFDLETGGHVFQLFLTNSSGLIEKKFITDTTGKWLKGDIIFGFNISRVFSFKK
jgi:hypothetical protein